MVFIPKCRRQALYKELRRSLGEVFQSLATRKGCRIEEGHLLPDHVHMLISIPPKYAVSQIVGFIKGESAIHIARTFMGRRQNYAGQHCWARARALPTILPGLLAQRQSACGEYRFRSPSVRRDAA